MILHVIKSNIYSGAENVVCQIIKGLSDKEEFIYMAPHGPIEEKLKALGLYDFYHGIDKLDVNAIKDAVAQYQPTVVQAHDFTASVLCGFALKGSVPVISHIHCNPLWLKNPIHPNSILYRMASKWFSTIITVSDAVEQEYCYSSKIKCPIKVLGNPFSAEQVLMASEGTFPKLKSDLLYVGRFNEAKNPLGAIKIFEALPNNSYLTFRMVGNGELLQECKNYAATTGITTEISFEGFKDNVYKYMKSTKILLMPSIFEGFGLVAVEAMSLGIPVVCSGVGGLSGIVDESCGYVCKTTEEYVSAINSLLSDSQLYSKKSAGALKRAQDYNNSDSYLYEMHKIYSKIKCHQF